MAQARGHTPPPRAIFDGPSIDQGPSLSTLPTLMRLTKCTLLPSQEWCASTEHIRCVLRLARSKESCFGCGGSYHPRVSTCPSRAAKEKGVGSIFGFRRGNCLAALRRPSHFMSRRSRGGLERAVGRGVPLGPSTAKPPS